jgi:hypothetical protein
MIENNILYEINQLPENLKLEALHYILFLKKEYLKSNNIINKSDKRIFGRVKGKYKLAADFDEPLEDFKEYM